MLLGSLAGVLLTPPGETWIASSARISTDIGNSPGSRVARHADAPWCIDGLTTAELRQVDMTNALLFAALLLALACLFAGVRFVLEHASVPNTPDLPSIWTTWPVQWLLRHPSVQQVLVHPSQHSAAHLLVVWMPRFQADMCSFAQSARHSSLQPSGQDEYVSNMSCGSFLNNGLNVTGSSDVPNSDGVQIWMQPKRLQKLVPELPVTSRRVACRPANPLFAVFCLLF